MNVAVVESSRAWIFGIFKSAKICYNKAMHTVIVKELENAMKPILEQEGVVRASLFGSYVRGEANDQSDIDVLVELPEGKSLLDLISLEMKLEEKLGKEVDVVTYDSLSPLLKNYILKDQIKIL